MRPVRPGVRATDGTQVAGPAQKKYLQVQRSMQLSLSFYVDLNPFHLERGVQGFRLLVYFGLYDTALD